MSMHYCCDARANSTTALPNISVIQERSHVCEDCGAEYPADADTCIACGGDDINPSLSSRAFFWWACCLPGCLPDSDWSGPFDTEDEALKDAREYVCACEDEADDATCSRCGGSGEVSAETPLNYGACIPCGWCGGNGSF